MTRKVISTFYVDSKLLEVLDTFCKNSNLHRSAFIEGAIKNQLSAELKKLEEGEKLECQSQVNPI